MHMIELDDRVGFVPGFRRTAGGEGVAAHSISAVARAGDSIDPLGLATVLMLGFPLGERTPIRGVERLPPGEVIGQDGRVQRSNALRPPSAPPAVDAQVELFLAACKRMLPAQRLVAMLSGGRDSRMILLALRQLGHAPEAILTVGRPGYVPDATVAQQVARRCGWEVESCVPAIYSGSAEIARHRAQSLESLEHAWLGCLERHANRHAGGAPFITDGLGAGVLSTGSLMDPEAIGLWRAGHLDELAEWVLRNAVGVGPEFLAAVSRAGYPVAPADEVRHELVRVLRSLSVWPNPLGAFSLFHWSRRGISASPFGLLAAPGRVFAPLCDGALVEALLAMEIDQAAAQDWREPLISRLWPDAHPVPFADGQPRRTWASQVRRVASSVMSRWHLKSCRGRLAKVAAAVDADRGPGRRSFNRSAVGLLSALESMIDAPAGRRSM